MPKPIRSIRTIAAELWAKQGEQAIPRLRESLHSADPTVRESVLLALTYMPKVHARLALPDVLTLCEDSDLKVQANALLLMSELSNDRAQIADLAVARLLTAEPTLVEAAMSALRSLGSAAVPAIAEVLPQATPEIQFCCLDLLIESAFDEGHGTEAQAAISTCLQSSDGNLRRHAYHLVASLRPLSSEELSRGIQDSQEDIVKFVVRKCLADHRLAPQDLPRLAELLSSKPALRVSVLAAMANFGPSASEYFPEILTWTEADAPAVRLSAARALVCVADDSERVRPVLAKLLLDANPQVAHQAGELLAKVAPQDLPGIAQNVLLPRVLWGEESVRLSAIAALSGMPEAAASKRLALIRLLATESSDMPVSTTVQFALAEALGDMGSHARDASPALMHLIHRTSPGDPRLAIPVAALGKIGTDDPAVLKLLMELHDLPHSRHSRLPLTVIEALGRLGGGNAAVLELLTKDAGHAKAARMRVAALRAIAHLETRSDTTQMAYIHALRNDNVNVRIAACLLLVENGDPDEAAVELSRLLDDSCYIVRIVAAHSLAALGSHAAERCRHFLGS